MLIMVRETEANSQRNVSETHPLLLAQYNALREEILKRVELRYQIVSLTLIVFGTTLSFGLQAHSSSTVLLYPIIALFLAASWIHNGFGIKEIGNYIRDQIESTVGEDIIGWEHRVRSQRKRLGGLGLSFLSAGGVFIGTSLLAILTAVPLAKFDTIEILFFILATISLISSVVLLGYYRSSGK
jgi:uncharacterized membrane protein YfcA